MITWPGRARQLQSIGGTPRQPARRSVTAVTVRSAAVPRMSRAWAADVKGAAPAPAPLPGCVFCDLLQTGGDRLLYKVGAEAQCTLRFAAA
jgi:hypothetical protein